jgi:hypothetical protein
MTMIKRERTLTGSRCQCGGCGLYFNSLSAFEKHRRDFRCLSLAEMTARGMVPDTAGWWMTKPSDDRPRSFPLALPRDF